MRAVMLAVLVSWAGCSNFALREARPKRPDHAHCMSYGWPAFDFAAALISGGMIAREIVRDDSSVEPGVQYIGLAIPSTFLDSSYLGFSGGRSCREETIETRGPRRLVDRSDTASNLER